MSPDVQMRTFKCILLCIGHIAVYLSITWTPDIQNYFDNPFTDIGIAIVLSALLMVIGVYIVVLPSSKLLTDDSKLAHIVAFIVILLYSALLVLLFMFVAPVIPERILHEFNLICGNVGVAFAVLVVYDNMKGAPIRDKYNDIMFELKQLENDIDGTGCGILDTDPHKGEFQL